MLTRAKKKFILSLQKNKFRTQHSSFVVEGEKLVGEFIESGFAGTIYANEEWCNRKNDIHLPIVQISNDELKAISILKTPNLALAVVQIPEVKSVNFLSNLTIALDRVRDPGNLGNIIRIADWFGIDSIICSKDSVDLYNSKVVQASMGSIFRVNVVYEDLKDVFSTYSNLTIYGASINGGSVYDLEIKDKGSVLLFGNESTGISKELLPLIKEHISIPGFGGAESLNIASSVAILCSEYRRG